MSEENKVEVTQPTESAQVAEQTPVDAQPPEAVAEQTPPVDPSVVGEAEPAELNMLNALMNKNRNLTFQIGDLEVRKALMLGQMQGIDEQAQAVYRSIGERLKLDPSTPWNLSPDGKVRIVSQPSKG